MKKNQVFGGMRYFYDICILKKTGLLFIKVLFLLLGDQHIKI